MPFHFQFHDAVGTLGAVILLTTYFLLQIERIQASSMLYSQLNALGSAMILASLVYDFNLSAFFIEFSWFVISCVGGVVTLRNQTSRKKRRQVERGQNKSDTN